jgi:hypothetical protein
LKQGTRGWCGQCFSPHIEQVGTNRSLFSLCSLETRLSVTLLTSIQNSQKRYQFPFWWPARLVSAQLSPDPVGRLGAVAGSENKIPLLRDTLFIIWAMVFQALSFYRTFLSIVNPNVSPAVAFRIQESPPNHMPASWVVLPFQHGAGVGASGHRGVFGEVAGFNFRFPRLPFFPACCKLLAGQFHVYLVAGDVDFDYVSFFQ